jgi:hypothetical protein
MAIDRAHRVTVLFIGTPWPPFAWRSATRAIETSGEASATYIIPIRYPNDIARWISSRYLSEESTVSMRKSTPPSMHVSFRVFDQELSRPNVGVEAPEIEPYRGVDRATLNQCRFARAVRPGDNPERGHYFGIASRAVLPIERRPFRWVLDFAVWPAFDQFAIQTAQQGQPGVKRFSYGGLDRFS